MDFTLEPLDYIDSSHCAALYIVAAVLDINSLLRSLTFQLYKNEQR